MTVSSHETHRSGEESDAVPVLLAVFYPRPPEA